MNYTMMHGLTNLKIKEQVQWGKNCTYKDHKLWKRTSPNILFWWYEETYKAMDQ